ncbi:hypothetical protein TRFO_26564 [Tritrichomonas foetus]|uniref:Uncharacterized protein n=1 Tax=Tritrichomonas foetus TaxID=1144522 RepID=A0A1J4K2E5_9EUKA|nr:hypothetical protein TRFO_26564 [Tritrichomonas foetus]|eukprot:OHT05617.1 hypothetical protein TRFO_26564 [Tritrichomonas foetus]
MVNIFVLYQWISMFNGFINKLNQRIQNSLALNQEEEEDNIVIEEEEEERDEGLLDSLDSDIDIDDDLNLDLDDDSDLGTSKGNLERKKMMPYFQAFSKISGLFPAEDFVKNPDSLPQKISELCKNIQSLTDEQETVRVLYDNYQNLKNLSDEVEKLENSREKSINENQALKEKLADLQNSIFDENLENSEKNNDSKNEKNEFGDKLEQINSATRKFNDLQRKLSQISSENDLMKAKIERLNKEIADSQNEDESIEEQLEEEREKYAALLLELSSIQSATGSSSNQNNSFEDQEVSNLEEEVAAMKQELERLSPSAKPPGTIEALEKRMAELAKKYQIICEDTQNKSNLPSSQNLTSSQTNHNDIYDSRNDDRINITSLLLKHYKGDKEAVNLLRNIFGWTDSDLAMMNPENRGFAGLIKKGARIFNRFSDTWTSWLLQAAEST